MSKKRKIDLLSKQFMILWVVVAAIVIYLTGNESYQGERERMVEEKYEILKAIADLKEEQLDNWLHERYSDAKVISHSTFFYENLSNWISNQGDEEQKQKIIQYLASPQETYDYENISISSVDGQHLLSVKKESKGIDSITRSHILLVSSNQIEFYSDLYYCPLDKKIQYEFIIPIAKNGDKPIAMIIFKINPNEFLFPLINSWPTPSETSETLILRKDGDSVVFLNELRHAKNTAFKLKIPMSRIDVPAIQAVLGHSGFLEGNDYRGVRVLSDTRQLTGTQWYMISKIDTEEMYEDFKEEAKQILSLGAILILSIVLILVFLYKQKQKIFYAKIEEQSERLEMSLLAAKAGSWEWNVRKKRYYWSDQIWELFEIDNPNSEKPIEVWNRIVHPDDLEMALSNYENAIRNEDKVEFEFSIVTESNKTKTLVTRGIPIFEANGKLEKYIGITIDITERVRAEEELRAKAEIVKAIPSGLFVYQYEEPDKFFLLSGNPASQSITNLNIEKTIGKEFKEIWSNHSMTGLVEAYTKVMQTSETFFGEEVFYNGESNHGIYNIIAFKMPSNRLGVVFEDVTEKKIAEKALEESQKFNETILNASPDLIYIYDLIGRTNIYCNDGAKKTLGYTSEEIKNLGSTMLETLMNKDDFERYKNEIIPKYQTALDNETIEHEYRILHKNGSCLWVRAKEIIFNRDVNGNPSQIFGTLSDITENKLINDTQHFLSQKGWLKTDEDFFSALVKFLSQTLDVEYALVAEIDEATKLAQTIALYIHGEIGDNIKYELHDTPCENVFDKELCIYEGDIQNLFSEDEMLVNMKAESYAGIPLWDSKGKPIGLIALLSTEKVRNKEIIAKLMPLVAVRVAGEIERKIAETALLESQELLNKVGEIAKIGGWEIDINTGQSNWTKGCYDIVGIDYSDPIPGYVEHVTYYLPEYRDLVRDSIHDLVENGVPLKYEAGFIAKDGQLKWCRINGDRVMENEKCVKIFGTMHDITEQKLIEDALSENQEIFEAFMKNSPVYIFFKDSEIRTLMLSDNYENVLGMPIEDAIGKTMYDLFPSDMAESIIESDKKILSEAKALTVNEELNGRHYETTKFPVFIDGKPKLLAGFTIDITEKKKADHELQKLAKLESLGILAGGIAHNFKNMLTSMTFSVELAKMKPDKANYYLDKISKSIEQSAALATRFQTFSNSGDPVLSPSNINEIIKNASEISLSGSGAKLILELDTSIPSVLLDDKQMNEVLTNLMINADQAMPNGGTILCKSKMLYLSNDEVANLSKGSYIRIEVEDEGMGIPDSHLHEIFTPFFSTKQKGQGLGLASVFYIVEKHNGYILVESEVEYGTTFRIYLPAVLSEQSHESFDESDIDFAKSLKILFLDDDDDIIETINEFTDNLGLNMTCINNPEQAMREYESSIDQAPFDIVILDLTLKGFRLDGLDVLNKVLEINSDAKVLVFSGHSSKPIVANYEKYGFSGRLEKPFVKKQFFYEIKRVVDGEG
jgi:PAS domain S-box-containing protein